MSLLPSDFLRHYPRLLFDGSYLYHLFWNGHFKIYEAVNQVPESEGAFQLQDQEKN